MMIGVVNLATYNSNAALAAQCEPHDFKTNSNALSHNRQSNGDLINILIKEFLQRKLSLYTMLLMDLQQKLIEVKKSHHSIFPTKITAIKCICLDSKTVIYPMQNLKKQLFQQTQKHMLVIIQQNTQLFKKCSGKISPEHFSWFLSF